MFLMIGFKADGETKVWMRSLTSDFSDYCGINEFKDY